MQNLNLELQECLKKIAFAKTIPYCYGCGIEARANRCPTCFSDDLMRLLPETGCDWGIDWVIRDLVRENLVPFSTETAFEESIRQCYPETVRVGWLELDTVDTIKQADAVSWQLALSGWFDAEESEGNITSFDGGSSYYLVSDIEEWLDLQDEDPAKAMA